MEVLFEDSQIIVCIKPPGILSQSDDCGRENMVLSLSEQTGGEIYPVHRLDRPVGGVMVFAKTSLAAKNLGRDIAEGSFEKEYFAAVEGFPQKSEDILSDFLFFDKRKNKSFVVSRERKGVKKAELLYSVQDKTMLSGTAVTLLKIRLFTGRTHQIRVQLASRKMPIIADRRYGSKTAGQDIALWSYRLCFNHPKTRQRLEFSKEPAGDIFSIFPKFKADNR